MSIANSLFATTCLLLLSACSGLPGRGSPASQPPPEPRGSTAVHTDAEAGAPHADLWSRLRDRFQLSDNLNPRIDAEVKRYRRHPKDLSTASERARPYLYLIGEQVEERQFPGEIALLPMVESGFRPHARSYQSAVGLWQIMPRTGSRFGLERDWWYDGRGDVYESTRAALDYLQYLNGLYDGDWLLTLAAYNAGEGRVRAAIRKNRGNGRPTDFWNLALPSETMRYVPKILAVARIVATPDAYGIRLAPLPDEPALIAIDTGGQIDLTLVAEFAGLPTKELYRYNPGYKRWATSPEGPHRVLVPVANAEMLRQALQDLPAEERITWRRHQIRSGETLSHIAARYSVDTGALQQANSLSSRNRIRAGDYLLVPSPRNPQSTRIAGGAGDTTPASSRKIEYTVRDGDSLWTIARRFGVSHVTLARWNNLALSSVLRPGKRLVVWA